MFDQILSVSDASDLINETLHAAVPALMIEGEVSGFNVNRGKFVFFDLKDDEALLPCFMMAFNLKFPIEDGMKIRVLVEPGLTAKGRFSLTVRELQPVGEGSLKKAFELLKKQLAAEGLFEPGRKRSLPDYPQKIGVVSSSGAAGWADFTKILNERWGGLYIQLADVTVQGLSAPGEVVRAIEYFNQQSQLVDALVVIRGGGSADDLAAFNHEEVVRAVAGSRIPTVVAIGHETDESLAELAADLRASTPSNAAQLLVPDKREVLRRISDGSRRAEQQIVQLMEAASDDITVIKESLSQALVRYFEAATQTVTHSLKVIEQLSPEAALKRGYALVRGDHGIISSIKMVHLGERVEVKLRDGKMEAIVDGKK